MYECGIIEDAVQIMVDCVRNEDIRNDMLQTTRLQTNNLKVIIQFCRILSLRTKI